MLLESADAFGAEVDGYRGELFAHCYRMLGTVDDAEHALQDALTRAWQGRHTHREQISFREAAWRDEAPGTTKPRARTPPAKT
jgi:RNA polymerase sigma-70 factor, ECF subfamily